jgi:hypothetical protein
MAWPLAVAAIAGAVNLVTVRSNWSYADDLDQLAYLRGIRPNIIGARGPLDIYSFGAQTAEKFQAAQDAGTIFWWISRTPPVRFFRPLSAALMKADSWALGVEPLGAHVHSLVWVIALAGLVALLFRRLLPAPAAVIAALFFATQARTAVGINWWCARHTLVGAALSVVALHMYLRWREDRFRPGLVISIASLTAALLASETGLQMAPYFVAYELLGSPAKDIRTRVRRVFTSPPVGVFVLYLVIYRVLGFGSSSTHYTDPIRDTSRWLANVVLFAPRVAAEFLFNGQSLRTLHPVLAKPSLNVESLVVLALFAVALAAWWRFSSSEPTPSARAPRPTLTWLVVGAVLSMIPISFLPPITGDSLRSSVRVLVIPSVGVSAMLGTIVAFTASVRSRDLPTFLKPLVAIAGLVAASQLVLGPRGVGVVTKPYRAFLEAPALSASQDAISPDTRRAIVLWSPGVSDFSLWNRLALLGQRPQLEVLWLLSNTTDACTVTRVDDRTLLMETKGTLFPVAWRSNDPVKAGREFLLRGLRIEILEADKGAVKRARFDFDRSLDSTDFAFFVHPPSGMSPVVLPQPGASLRLGPSKS